MPASENRRLLLARLVAFLVASEAGDRLALAQAIRSGEALEPILERAPGRVNYWRDLIQDFAQSQFADRSRPIVEILTNSVDAVQGDYPKEVALGVGRGGASVIDQGRGMGLEVVLEKLLIPLLSGKEGQKTTGRFGVGFYSVLQYLKSEENRIEVSTSDGREAFRLILRNFAGEPHVAFERLPDETRRGTSIAIHAEFPVAHTESVVREALQFNAQALIFFNGERINEGAEDRAGEENPLALNRIPGEDVTLLYHQEGEGRVYVSVNGVTIFSKPLEGKNVPGTLVVDFPVETQLSVSRNMLLVDDMTRRMTRQAADLAAAQDDPYPFLNALAPVMSELQARNPSARIEDNLEIALSSLAQGLASRESRPILPDAPGLEEIDLASPIRLHPSLFESLPGGPWPFRDYEDFKPSLFGKRYRLLLAPFKGEGVIKQYKDVLLLNEKLRPKTFLGKAALQAYLNIAGFSGKIRVPWTRQDTLGLLLAPFRRAYETLLTFLPSQAAKLLHGASDLLSRPKKAGLGREKAFGDQEEAFAKTLRPGERIFSAGASLLSLLAFFKISSALLIPALALVLPAGQAASLAVLGIPLLSVTVYLIYLNGPAAKGIKRLVYQWRPYKPRYAFINLAIASYFLSLAPAFAQAHPLTTILVPPLFTWAPMAVFLFSIRGWIQDMGVMALTSGYLLWKSLPLAWRWLSLPRQQRKGIASLFSVKPSRWALAAFLALALSSPRVSQAPDQQALDSAIQRLGAMEFSYGNMVAGLPLTAKNPGLALKILTEYDPLYFKTYLEMAGVLTRKFPSLALRPLGRKYSVLWEKDILRKDRQSLEKIASSLAAFSSIRDRQVPRTLRPALIHLLGLGRVGRMDFAESTMPPEAMGGVVEFNLSQLISHALKGSGPLRDQEELKAALSEPSPPLRTKVASRALANSVNFQSANPFIFIRELAQNAMDEAESRQVPQAERLFEVRTQLGGGRLVLSLRDRLGMDFERLVNYLLVPNASTKRGDPRFIGQYGHGFLTLLTGAEEVLVKTSRGNGRTLYLRLIPKREGGKVSEVQVLLAQAEESFIGTKFVWSKASSAPELDSSHLKAQAVTLAGLVSEQDLTIDWDGRRLNKAKGLIGRAPSPYGELALYQFLEENSIVQRGLYVRDIDEEYARFIPGAAREILLKKGIVVELPRGLKLTRDRSDIIFKNELLPVVGNALGQASLSALVEMYLKGEVEADRLFPRDFLEKAKEYQESVPEFVLEDLSRLQRGEAIQDPGLYENPTNLAMLLGSIAAIKLRYSSRVRGRVSLLWALKAVQEGRIHWLQLPPEFSDLLLGKTLWKLVWKYALRLGLAALAGYLLWKAALPVWNGIESVIIEFLPQEEVSALVEKWGFFSRIQPDPGIETSLFLEHGAEAHNPFLLALSMIKRFFAPGGPFWLGLPLLATGGALYGLYRFHSSEMRRLPARVEKDKDLYWAFSDWTSRSASEILAEDGWKPEVESIYARSLWDPAASAEQGRPRIFWNLGYFFLQWKPLRAFRAFLGGSRSRGTFKGMTKLLDVLTHEAAHVAEEPGEWTEDSEHRERQARLLGRALEREEELAHLTQEVRHSYRGRPGDLLGLMRGMSSYPETSLEQELWPGETLEPFPLRSHQEALASYEEEGAGILGEARRNRFGSYEAAGDPLAEEARAAAESLARAGMDPGLRRIVLLGGEQEGFEWTHDGTLFVSEAGITRVLRESGSQALTRRDVLIQLLLRYALGPGLPRNARLSPQELEAAGLWPGGLKVDLALKQAKKNARRIRWGLVGSTLGKILLYGILGYASFLMIGALKDMINSGLIALIPTPNLLGWTLLVLPALWPLMRWLLGKFQTGFDSLEARGLAPGLEKMAPIMRETIGKMAGWDREAPVKENGRRNSSIRATAGYGAAAFLEEYLFRYLLFHGLGSWLAASFGVSALLALPAAALLSALLFALFHFPNWRDLTFKQALGLILYYGSAGLFFTLLYWASGIWIAAFVHFYYNTHDLSGEEERQDDQVKKDKTLEDVPEQDLAGELAVLPPRQAKTVLVGEGLQQRVATLIEAVSQRLPGSERRAVLGELSRLAFIESEAVSAGFEASEPVLALRRDLAEGRIDGPGFGRLLNRFIEELPPQMLKPALGYLLKRLEAPIADYLEKARKPDLPRELEAFRGGLESAVSRSLGIPLSLRVFQAEELMRVDSGWGWPLIQFSEEGATAWLPERMLYALKESAQPWAEPLARLILEARRAPGAPLASVGEEPFEKLGNAVAAAAGEMETHKPWLAKYKSTFLWSLLSGYVAIRLLPLVKLLIAAPSAGFALAWAKLGLFAANLASPAFLVPFLAALILDWGTKLWVNRLLPQVDHREFYKARWRALGPGWLRFRITNVLHYVHTPRFLFTVFLPIAMIFGGIDASANPVFAAILMAGALGNMGEVMLRRGATDWIPVGFGVANIADFAIALGLLGPFLLALPQLALGLFIGGIVHAIASRRLKARSSGKPGFPAR